MKILISSQARKRNRQGGFIAVMVMLILLGLILGFIVANMHSLSTLHRDIKLLDQKQVQRLAYASTNAPPTSQNSTNAPANQ